MGIYRSGCRTSSLLPKKLTELGGLSYVVTLSIGLTLFCVCDVLLLFGSQIIPRCITIVAHTKH
jgi:hypothetical protein